VKGPFSPSSSQEQISREDLKAVEVSERRTSYFLYWDRVKELFLKSQWFAQVDMILHENGILRILQSTILRPAEVFFNTATEVFGVQSDLQGFLSTMRGRVGPVWDSRLADLAAAFFRAAKTICDSVGSQKCFLGLQNLTKARRDMAVDDLTAHFDRALDRKEVSKQIEAKIISRPFSTLGTVGTVRKSLMDTESNQAKACTIMKSRKRRKAGEKGKGKHLRRYRQANPYSRDPLPQIIRRKLKLKNWFNKVDVILRENDFIKALPKKIIPSSHFFDTATRIFQAHSNVESSDQFTTSLQLALGFAWDIRLAPLSNEFYLIARPALRKHRYDAESLCGNLQSRRQNN